MPVAFFSLVACQLVGESLRLLLGIPIPGPVIGMFLLTALLARRPAPPALDATAGALLRYLSLLFVPAGVGVVSELDLLRAQALPLAGGLVASAVLGLAVTAWVMQRTARRA